MANLAVSAKVRLWPIGCRIVIFRTIDARMLLKVGVVASLALMSQLSHAEIFEAPGKISDEALKFRNEAVAAAQARLGANLIRQLAQGRKADNNIVVSPASLASILSFVELGGSDAMRMAIHRTLGFAPAAKGRVSQDIKELRNRVSATIANSTKDSPTNLANLLVFDPSIKPRQPALLGLSGAGADVLVADLSAAETVGRINRWVRERTHELIPSILEEAPATVGLVAINALYFKDRWKTPFDAARTERAQFTPHSGKPVDVMMMHSPVVKFAFRETDRFIAAELGYANNDFKLVVVTTKSTPAEADEFAAVTSWLQGGGFDSRNGEIALPKLTVSVNEEMLGTLDRLGFKPARLASGSLRGFSPASLAIARVVQKLELRVDEEGTEAAAATAVIATRSIARDQHVKMLVDKPFLFALRDQRTGFILFMGYVASPHKLAAR
jgi:serine protease inhibitor